VPASPSRRRRRRSTAARSPSNPTACSPPYRFGKPPSPTGGTPCQLARSASWAAPWLFKYLGPSNFPPAHFSNPVKYFSYKFTYWTPLWNWIFSNLLSQILWNWYFWKA
jgi:hypothetical protein